MNREYHSWWSWRLNRNMELLVFGHAGAKMIVFPTREGRFYEYENLRMTEVLRDKLANGFLQLFCVDGIDSESFYCRWAHPSGRIERHRQYEEYVLNEVFPFMSLKNPHQCVIAHGCSLGAYHAVNIATRHPHLFRKLAAFSGRYDLTMSVEGFPDLFEGYYNEDVYFHTPTHFLPNLSCAQRLAHLRSMDVVLTIGESDPFRGNNEYLSQILHGKGVPHQLHVWEDRAHSAYYWRRMARIYV
jgi:esterase/lipase superfamily enzyme